MKTSTIIHCTNIARTLALIIGLLLSSLEPLLHGLETDLFLHGEAGLVNAQGAAQGDGGRAEEDEDMVDLVY